MFMENYRNRKKEALIEDIAEEAVTMIGVLVSSIYCIKCEFKSSNLSIPGNKRKHTENDRRQNKIDELLFQLSEVKCILSFS